MTVENRKQQCFESICFGINRTAAWRRKLDSKFPYDQRNAVAADTLTKLATDSSGLSDEAWHALQSHYEWNSTRWREAISAAARQIEFTVKTDTFDSFVSRLIAQVETETV